jgi:hypothetical protein
MDQITDHLVSKDFARRSGDQRWWCGNPGPHRAVHWHKVVLKMDISNAHNAISRIAILEAVERHIPEIRPYSHLACYEDTQVSFTSMDKTFSLLLPSLASRNISEGVFR